jgi:predicted ester cyclase
VIAEDDKVVLRVTAGGTHQGEFQGIPATGRTVTITGMGIARIEDGRIAESWWDFDALGLMQQLGAVPAPAV